MKSIYLFIFLSLFLVGCAKSNNPWVNWVPGVSPDYSAPICDQTRAPVCKMADLDAISAIMRDYFQIMAYRGQMTKADAQAMISSIQTLLDRPNLTSGLLISVLKNHPEAALIYVIAQNHGMNLDVGMGSTYIFQPADIDTMKQYANKMSIWVDTQMITFDRNMSGEVSWLGPMGIDYGLN
jgi:hypothetical protein